MNSNVYSLAFVLLAGGESARYKGNKLLSEHPSSALPLIQHCINEVVSARNELTLASSLPITVVSGKWHDSICAQLKRLALTPSQHSLSVAHNGNWAEGIASSIRTGIENVANVSLSQSRTDSGLNTKPTHVLFTLADLPSLNAQDFIRLINTSKAQPNNIVCSEWHMEGETNSRLTVPAIFPESMFSELVALKGDVGAKLIIQKYAKVDRVTTVSIPNAQFDIDTPQDWDKLKRRG